VHSRLPVSPVAFIEPCTLRWRAAVLRPVPLPETLLAYEMSLTPMGLRNAVLVHEATHRVGRTCKCAAEDHLSRLCNLPASLADCTTPSCRRYSPNLGVTRLSRTRHAQWLSTVDGTSWVEAGAPVLPDWKSRQEGSRQPPHIILTRKPASIFSSTRHCSPVTPLLQLLHLCCQT